MPVKKLFYILWVMFPLVSGAQQPRAGDSSPGHTWVNVGEPGFSAGFADYSNIVIGPGQVPYAAFNDDTYGMRACVMKFDGTSWVDVGTPGFTPAQADRISLAIGPSGEPWIAFLDYSVNLRTSVMRFNGSAWEYVGDTGFSYTNAEWPRIAFSPAGQPYVSFVDENKVSVMKYNDSMWVYAGPRKFSDQTSYDDFAFSPADGMPYVAYSNTSLAGRATVDRFDGVNWVHVGNPGFSAGALTWLNLAFDQAGKPYAGYCDFAAPNDALTVMTFNGNSWENVGSPGFNPGWPLSPSLAIGPDNMPYVAWIEYFAQVSAMKFDGTKWVFVGNPNFSTGTAERLDMAIDSSGRIYVVYADWDQDRRETVMKYDTLAVGMQEKHSSRFTLYPNPARDKITVETDPGDILSIHDLTGRLLLQKALPARTNPIELNGFLPGVYLVKVSGEKAVKMGKLIIR